MTPPKYFTRHDKYTKKRLVFSALYHYQRALTCRELSEITGLEIAILCRIIFNQTYKSRILKISYIKPCKTTRRNVYYNNLIDAVEGFKNEN